MATDGDRINIKGNNHGVQVAQANDSQIHNHFYAQQEQPKSPARPCMRIPFRRDNDFVERGTLLDSVRTKCATPASCTALVGIGGVGKSQLAIEHCYRTEEELPDTWIFWVHGSNTARLAESYRDIAKQVKLSGLADPQADIIKAVYEWLCDEKNGKWLLVLDNVDEAAVLSPAPDNGNSTPRPRLEAYVPSRKHGSILITSRSKDVALQFVEHANVIPIDPMGNADAEALLRKKVGTEADQEGIPELATALEYMPLALVQAGAFIRNQRSRGSVRKYLETFRKNDKNKTKLLKRTAPNHQRDHEASHSTLTTWQISFEHILNTRESAADLLSLMSFFDRQGIPEALLRATPSDELERPSSTGGDNNQRDNEEDSVASNDSILDPFEDDIVTLQDYSFISLSTHPELFEMHALVQLATRNWLRDKGKFEKWKCQFIVNLCEEFPESEFDDWAKRRLYFPHARSALAQEPTDEALQKRWARLLFLAARFASQEKNASDLEMMAIGAKEAFGRLYGNTHMQTLNCIACLAMAESLKGQWRAAEELLEGVVQTYRGTYGLKHKETLNTMANLATLYWKHDQHEKSQALNSLVMELTTQLLGPDDPQTIRGVAHMAKTYFKMGQFATSEELHRHVVNWDRKAYGMDHFITLIDTDNLARVLWTRRNWKEAQELLVPVSQMLEQKLGPESMNAVASKGVLALTYLDEGRLKEAAELEVHVMEVKRRMFGPKSPDVLVAMSKVGSTWIKLGRFSEAQILLEEVVDSRKEVLGPDHLYTLRNIYSLTQALWMQGYFQRAEELELQTSEAWSKVDGADPRWLSGVALVQRRQGRWDLVCKLQCGVTLAFARGFSPAENMYVLVGVGKLAKFLKERGRSPQAIAAMRRFLCLGGKLVGCMHPNLLFFFRLLGQWYSEVSQTPEAVSTV